MIFMSLEMQFEGLQFFLHTTNEQGIKHERRKRRFMIFCLNFLKKKL
jgi:hypothetical protein